MLIFVFNNKIKQLVFILKFITCDFLDENVGVGNGLFDETMRHT